MDGIKTYSTVKLDEDKCKGCITCMRRCPTEAIRVRNGKAHVHYDLCIGCGVCIRMCPHHAKRAVYDSLNLMDKFKYKVALPAPSLYGQFNNLDDVNYVLTGLKRIGFDDVVEVSSGAELVSEASRKMMESGEAVKPVISSACPAIVELILIRFHDLKKNLLPMLAPVDVAAKLARDKAKKETGLDDSDIGVFFISPCPAKVFGIRNRLGVNERIIDGILAQSEIYFKLIGEMKKIETPERLVKSGIVGIGWASSGGEAAGTLHEKYLAADGIENCMSILKELEDGKLNDIDFVELNACPGGCVGGVLNIENPFVAKAKIQTLRKYLPVTKSKLKDYGMTTEDIRWEKEPQIVDTLQVSKDRGEAMRIISEIEKVNKLLPQIDCGNCGAPSCRAFAEDVVMENISINNCIKIVEQSESEKGDK